MESNLENFRASTIAGQQMQLKLLDFYSRYLFSTLHYCNPADPITSYTQPTLVGKTYKEVLM